MNILFHSSDILPQKVVLSTKNPPIGGFWVELVLPAGEYSKNEGTPTSDTDMEAINFRCAHGCNK